MRFWIWLRWGCCLVLGVVFLYAGMGKALASAQFALALVPFTVIPGEWLGGIARGLPVVEILGAVLVLVPRTSRIGAGVLLVLLLIFIGLLGWALANGIIVACGCFGVEETPSAGKMAAALGRDVGLAVMAGVVVFGPRGKVSPRVGGG